MVLATRLKNFKQSKTNKILCFVLAVAFATSFICSFVPFFTYLCYVDIESAFLQQSSLLDVTDNTNFSWRFYNDVQTVIDCVNNKAITQEFENDNADVLKQAVSDYYNLQQSEGCYIDGETGEYVYESHFHQSYTFKQYGNVVLNSPYGLNEEELLQSFLHQIISYYSYYDYNNAKQRLDEEIAKCPNFKYYAINGDVVVSNVEDADAFVKNIKSYGCYYIADGTQTESSYSLSYVYTSAGSTDLYESNKIYVALDFENLNVMTDEDDYYRQMYREVSIAAQNDFHLCFVVLCMSLILLLALLVYSLTCTGRLTKLDKMPNDIRFLLFAVVLAGFVALGFGLVYLFNCRVHSDYTAYQIFDKFANFQLIYVASVAVITGGFLTVYFYLASLIRQGKNGVNIIKNTLLYKLVKSIASKCKKVIIKIAKLVAYKPANFNSFVVKWILIYILFNLINIAAIIFFAVCHATVLIALVLVFIIIANIACAVFVIIYISNLDKIITAMHLRQQPNVNYSSLPNSLKVIVDSMQYTQDELNKAVNQAVKDEKLRSELITNVSHDLKTPLTSIINYVDLLSKCDIQGEQEREYISVLTDKSQKLKRLVDDLVEASKITSGVVTINPVMLNLNELVIQALADAQKDFDASNLTVVSKCQTDVINAFADGNKAYRIVDNLLTNAKKYSAPNTRVYIDTYYQGDFAIVEVKNISAQPLDIPADELTERFVRGDKSRSKEGNGLGLSIAQNLCIAQGGNLKITIDGDLFKAQVFLPKSR